jgi:malate dehydrogenase (oxaloacetate-decarboxylating)(NADP+)
MYIFPGLGFGAIVCKATTITDSMIDASATSLAASLLPSEISQGLLYPDLTRIRDVSVQVACGVIRAAQEAGVDHEESLRGIADEELRNFVKSRMYDPFQETQPVENGLNGGILNGLENSHL